MIAAFGHLVIIVTDNYFQLFRLTFESVRRLISQILSARFRWKQTENQMYRMGVESFPIIVFSMIFISMMLMVEFTQAQL